MEFADRVSLNIELPSASRLSEVSSMKNYDTDMLNCQKHIQHFNQKGLAPAGQTTQFIVGSANESDWEIIERLDWEYNNLDLKRGYFSSFTPFKGTPIKKPNGINHQERKREHFLYRLDWLIRKYDYHVDEIRSIMDKNEMIPLNIDPKVSLALTDDIFPIDVNEASFNELLRVPGIGETSARRIINLRRVNQKIETHRDLQRAGAVVKRARSFLVINGHRETKIIDYFTKSLGS
jgi:predicted DNA-binding helix-hairpin-helix protein